MKFVSTEFAVFFFATVALFLLVRASSRSLLLLIASYVFYGTWSVPFLGVLLFTTTIDYFASKCIHENASITARKFALYGAVAINLSTLGFFKYFNFFLDVNNSFFGLLHVQNGLPKHLEIILPLGISYYTFEAISYLVDVYRGAKPAPTWFAYNFYIMWFPHLIAGPIVRFSELWPQYRDKIELPSMDRVTKGIELILLGYFFKVVIADSCPTVVDPVFAAPAAASTLASYHATLAFMTQLYFDFLGYTHIARGVSLIFNIELPINFSHPFNSNNYAVFWQRWQISLSRWLHDYVYKPLGGSRKFLPRTMINVFITFVIAGIWHGAGWTFVVLGVYFGAVVSLYHAYRRVRKSVLGPHDRLVVDNPLYKLSGHFLAFSLMAISAVLFRSQTIETDWRMLSNLSNVRSLVKQTAQLASQGDYLQIGSCVMLLFTLLSGPYLVRLYQKLLMPAPYWFKLQTATCVVFLCWIYCASVVPQFIYFQF